MAPTLVREPVHRAGWIYEEKVDGWRIVAYKDRDSVRLVSRTGVDHSRRFRDIAAAIAKLSARTLVLDGEVAIFDEQLRSRFDWLREPEQPLRRRLSTWRSTFSTATAASYRAPAGASARQAGGRRRRKRVGVPGSATRA